MNLHEDLHLSGFPKGTFVTHRIGSDCYGKEDQQFKRRHRLNGLKIMRFVQDRKWNVYAMNRHGDLVLIRTDG